MGANLPVHQTQNEREAFQASLASLQESSREIQRHLDQFQGQMEREQKGQERYLELLINSTTERDKKAQILEAKNIIEKKKVLQTTEICRNLLTYLRQCRILKDEEEYEGKLNELREIGVSLRFAAKYFSVGQILSPLSKVIDEELENFKIKDEGTELVDKNLRMLAQQVSNMQIFFYLNQQFSQKFQMAPEQIGIDAGFIAQNLYAEHQFSRRSSTERAEEGRRDIPQFEKQPDVPRFSLNPTSNYSFTHFGNNNQNQVVQMHQNFPSSSTGFSTNEQKVVFISHTQVQGQGQTFSSNDKSMEVQRNGVTVTEQQNNQVLIDKIMKKVSEKNETIVKVRLSSGTSNSTEAAQCNFALTQDQVREPREGRDGPLIINSTQTGICNYNLAPNPSIPQSTKVSHTKNKSLSHHSNQTVMHTYYYTKTNPAPSQPQIQKCDKISNVQKNISQPLSANNQGYLQVGSNLSSEKEPVIKRETKEATGNQTINGYGTHPAGFTANSPPFYGTSNQQQANGHQNSHTMQQIITQNHHLAHHQVGEQNVNLSNATSTEKIRNKTFQVVREKKELSTFNAENHLQTNTTTTTIPSSGQTATNANPVATTPGNQNNNPFPHPPSHQQQQQPQQHNKVMLMQILSDQTLNKPQTTQAPTNNANNNHNMQNNNSNNPSFQTQKPSSNNLGNNAPNHHPATTPNSNLNTPANGNAIGTNGVGSPGTDHNTFGQYFRQVSNPNVSLTQNNVVSPHGKTFYLEGNTNNLSDQALREGRTQSVLHYYHGIHNQNQNQLQKNRTPFQGGGPQQQPMHLQLHQHQKGVIPLKGAPSESPPNRVGKTNPKGAPYGTNQPGGRNQQNQNCYSGPNLMGPQILGQNKNYNNQLLNAPHDNGKSPMINHKGHPVQQQQQQSQPVNQKKIPVVDVKKMTAAVHIPIQETVREDNNDGFQFAQSQIQYRPLKASEIRLNTSAVICQYTPSKLRNDENLSFNF